MCIQGNPWTGMYCPYQESRKHDRDNIENEQKIPDVFYKTDGTFISFYAAFDGENCSWGSKWCKKHCYMKTQPFDIEVVAKIQSISLDNIDVYEYSKKIADCITTEKYITLFASGCIEKTNDVDKLVSNVGEEINRRKKSDAIIRVFVRDSPYSCEFSNSVYIWSIDRDAYEYGLHLALEEFPGIHKSSIAIIDHPDNKNLIKRLLDPETQKKAGIIKVIRCSECCGFRAQCFEEKGKFLLIQKYQGTKPDTTGSCSFNSKSKNIYGNNFRKRGEA